jgi:competence protein ComGC
MRFNSFANVGQDTVVLVILLLFFAVLTILFIPFIVKEHQAARSRDNWRKATSSSIVVDDVTQKSFMMYPVNSRNISLDSPPTYNDPKHFL